MPSRSVSTLTNPTGIREIARNHVAIVTRDIDGAKHFDVTKLDLTHYKLAPDLEVIVLADAGGTRVRTELGSVGAWVPGPHTLEGLDSSAVLRFRVIVRAPNNPVLVAASDRISSASEGDAESLIAVETAELGQLLWRVHISEYEAVVQCNISVFPTGASALANVAFRTLVIPEALRQVLSELARDPSKLTAEGSSWSGWQPWLQQLGFAELPDAFNDDAVKSWVNEVVDRFCSRHRFADELHFSAQREQT